MSEGAATAAVIGGGPAGLMAAEVLAGAGVAVTVYEQTRSVGRKFLLAGRGGLNITNSDDRAAFVARYDAPEWIGPLLDAFDADDLRRWCDGLDESTFVGSSGRVFPESLRATPLLRAWLRKLTDLGVVVETQHQWMGWADAGLRIEVADGSERVETPDLTVIALGGASWPRVGSDGGWVTTFEAAGVEVEALRPSNVGGVVAWSNDFAVRFAGEPLKNVAVGCDGTWVRGDPVVTSSGLEGGPIYALSRPIRSQFDADGAATIEIDLHPDQSAEQLATRLGRRRPKDSMSTWLRRSIGVRPVAVNLLREAAGNRLPDGAGEMATLVKRVPVAVSAVTPIERAISTAGGVARHELDDALMLRSRPGTFVAGEMIDWEAPTGGYLLQACFSTGVAAARGALAYLVP